MAMAALLPAPRFIPVQPVFPKPVLVPALAPRRHVLPSREALVEHGGRLAIVLAAACIAIFLDASTSYESSTALPYIQGVVGATPDEGSWIVTLFNAAYDSSILLSPYFLTRFGRRNYFVGSLVAFAFFSLACAFTTEYHAFLIVRLLQGFALGGFFACGVLSLFMSIPGPLRLIGIMLFSMASQMGSAIGPAVAGYLVYNDAWQLVFVYSAIPAIVLAIGIGLVLRDPVEPERVPFDVVGAILITITFLTLQYVVSEGERRNWGDDPWVVFACIVAPISGVAMMIWKLRFSPHPFLDFRVLRHRNLVVGALFGFGFGLLLQTATQIGGFVESTLAFTPTLGGDLDALRAIAILIFVPIVTFAIAENVLDVRAALSLGLIATFVGFRIEVVSTTAGSDFCSFILPFAGIGIGIAILYRALASVIVGSLPPEDLIMGLIVYKMSGVLGGAIAAPIFATLLDHTYAGRQHDLAAAASLGAPAVNTFVRSAGGSAADLAKLVAEQASSLAYSDLWSIASLIVLALVPVIFLLDTRSAAQPTN
jgi:DHA2 family multidrug resistance protein